MKAWQGPRITVCLTVAAVILVSSSCAALKTSYPILSQREYEKMLVGPLEADYIGNETCLKSCHEHDAVEAYLKQSVHGQQAAEDTGMPLVNCETCHGAGSLAVEHAAENKKCDTSQLLKLAELPPGAVSLLCLKCHSSYSMSNMQFWPISQHAQGDVSCADCHKLHKSAEQELRGEEVNALCFGCHPEVRASFTLFSRHPLLEGKMTCASCHDPHGSLSEQQLTGVDIKDVCVNCHADRTGPYTFEHADLMDDCGNCHSPHGSPFAGLLRYGEPFLCLECHTGHSERGEGAATSAGYKRGFFTKCTSCHAEVHGTDSPGDMPSRNTFIY